MKPIVLVPVLLTILAIGIGAYLLSESSEDDSLQLTKTPNAEESAQAKRKETQPAHVSVKATPATTQTSDKEGSETEDYPDGEQPQKIEDNPPTPDPAPLLRREGESEADRKMREITNDLRKRFMLPKTSDVPPVGGFAKQPVIHATSSDAGSSAYRPLRSGHEYRSGSFIPKEQLSDDFSIDIVGEVFEVRDGVRYPLSGVMLNDFQGRRRVFTDNQGRFEMSAYYRDTLAETRNSRDDRTDNDAVYILASADGYEMALAQVGGQNGSGVRSRDGLWFFIDQLPKQPNGKVLLPIEMRWVDTEAVRVKLVNPPSDPTTITISVEAMDPGSIWSDQPFFANAQADASGEATFTVSPRRMLHIRAKGQGFSEKSDGITFDPILKVWNVELRSAQLTWITGNITDLRSSEPVSGVRISVGEDYYGTNGAAYTNAQGDYAGWFDVQNSRAMLAQHTSYARTSGSFSAGETSLDFTMRPLVQWKGRIYLESAGAPTGVSMAFYQEAGGYQVFVPLGRDAQGKTTLDTQGLPWGAVFIDFYIRQEPTEPPVRHRILFETVVWNERDLYEGDVRTRVFGH